MRRNQGNTSLHASLTWLCVLLIAMLVLTSSCTKQQQQPQEKQTVTIGAIFPLTGVRADAGVYVKNGVELAVQEINSNPRKKYRLHVIYEDDAYDPKQTVTAFQKLKDVDGVNYVIGAHSSSSTLAIAPLAEEARIILITPGSQSTDITNAGDYIFRTQINTAHEGTFWALWLANHTKGERLSIIGINTDYLPSFIGSFEEPFTAAGGNLGSVEKVEKEQVDFRTELLKAAEDNTKHILLVTIAKQAGLMVKQAKELGINASFYGTSPIEGEEFLKAAGGAAEGFLYPYPYDDTSRDAVMADFRERYLQAYGERNEVLAANGYDTVMVLHRCFERAGADVEGVKQCLYRTKNYSGASGRFSFDEHGDVSKPFVVKRVTNGEFMKLS